MFVNNVNQQYPIHSAQGLPSNYVLSLFRSPVDQTILDCRRKAWGGRGSALDIQETVCYATLIVS